MNAENRTGQVSGDFLSKSEAAFNALREQLKTNPKLDFIEGFHIFPKNSLSVNYNVSAECLIMYVAPKNPILNLEEMGVFIRDLRDDFDKGSKTEAMQINYPSSHKLPHQGIDMWVGGLEKSIIIDRVKATTTYSWKENSPLKDLPNIDTLPSERETCLTRDIVIWVFPDKVSAMEAVEKHKSNEQSFTSILTYGEFKRLEERSKKGIKRVINSLMSRSKPQKGK